MSIHYDEKGKFFSSIITKTRVRATIQTIAFRIDGHIYISDTERTKDALNHEERFLAVTDAIVYDADSSRIFEPKFIAVNRNHIIWVIPLEGEPEEQGEEYDSK